MQAFDRFIHTVHLQRPYHAGCRLYQRLANQFRKDSRRFAPSPEFAKAQHTAAAMKMLEDFLWSRGTLDIPRSDPPLVSVVIVLYNRAELTFACLRSLLGSSVPFEVICVDNGSTDHTERLLSRVTGVRYMRNTENLHFLKASNQGVKEARGRFVLLLNSDTEVLPGSLQAAVRRITSDARVGVVGGRLIHPDGRLQEAGCFVWADGTCEGYGRGANPDDGSFLFWRPVDFCSGAFLLTRRELWDRLGGLDEAFCPAYYEEADYCFRARESGMSVVYEPRATIRHYEFASSGVGAPPTELMLANQKRFATRHAALLSDRPKPHSAPAVRMRSPAESMKKWILVCDELLPHIKKGAGYPRANRLVSALIELGHPVTLFPMALSPDDRNLMNAYDDIPEGAEVLALGDYGQDGLERTLRERQGLYGTLIVSRPTTMAVIRKLMQRAPELFERLHLIYDAEAIFTIREQLEKANAGQPLPAVEAERRIGDELSLCEGFHTVLTVSHAEAALFASHGKNPFVVGHAVPDVVSTTPWASRTDFLFLGSIQGDGGPNFEAACWFLDKVWEQLAKRIPQSRFVIAGRNLSHRLTRTPLPERVVVTGELDCLDSVYDSARVFVAPTFASAGIPLKVVEAAGRGIPVVGTALLAKQLDWRDDLELSVGGSPEEFLEKSQALYLDQMLWERQREAAMKRVAAEYSRQVFRDQLRRALAEGLPMESATESVTARQQA